jgi:CHAD domain-containing protein
MAFRFQQKESGSDGVKRIALERLNRVLRNLARKPAPSPKSIHEARKDLKSLRALWRLIRKAIDPEEWRSDNIIFRDAGRTLARKRDAQVMMETLKELLESDQDSPSGDSARFSSTTARIREELERDAKQRISGSLLQGCLQSLRSVKQRLPKWLQPPPDANGSSWNTLFSGGMRQTYRSGRKLLRQCEVVGPDVFAEESWHKLRKYGKTLGYQLRLIRPIWTGPLKQVIGELDELTDALGKNHDLVVLRGRLADQSYPADVAQPADQHRRELLNLITHRQAKLKATALDRARRVYVEKPRQFEKRLGAYWAIWHAPTILKASVEESPQTAGDDQ